VTTTNDITEADRALKAKHRAMWASGDYPAVARDIVGGLGPILVAASGVGPGERVLDVAAGSGNASIPAATAGASVVASDLTPELFETGRKTAAEAGVEIDWQQADAEALPYPDASFDTVLSCIGVMFAPHHQASADELVRVLRPGGTLGLLCWTPEGFIGQMFATMKPYAPPPPPGAQPPPLWGDEDHVRALLGARVTEVSTSRASLAVDAFATPAELRDYFKANYGPTIAVYRAIADDPEKVAALDRELEDLGHRFDRGAAGSSVLDWEYLLLTCERT
jgi:SAM-dependent methyltransferase